MVKAFQTPVLNLEPVKMRMNNYLMHAKMTAILSD